MQRPFLDKSLFEDEIEPYNPGYIPLKISDLKDFGKDDKGKVFNEFEEILRHNNISDRSNAFNRIISLILAKIVDENKGQKAITDFQVKEGIDDAETLLERLQSLYSKAMRDYLDEEVIDYKMEDIEKEIANFPRQTAKDNLYRIYKELKFYHNNEFAFKEVYNKKLFEENSKVLEEVVRLFQKYRFKYDQKAQFLGDFFELMLESGCKQSEGQFFTPTPIARFIISSIPLKSIVYEKLQKGEKLFLPKIIDFACGSGHFLTEAIQEINDLIKEIDISKFKDDKSIIELEYYKKDMRWAQKYIFGIEKDYRLARTSQVACFMHGDGDANIIFGDGLEKHQKLDKDGSFDVLIANPPYTIKDFKKHLKVNPHDFEIWEHVTPDSDDIEVFFIERMKKLLCPGAMAGIILPSSILSNLGCYTKAREIILKNFEIKAITEFGGGTFGATSTNTVTLFLKKRHQDFAVNCQYIAEDFILGNKKREGDFLNSKEIFENYVSLLELEIDDYKTLVARKPNSAIIKTEFYKNYRDRFEGLKEIVNLKKRNTFKKLWKAEQEKKLESMFFDFVLEMETEKFFYYLLTHRIDQEATGDAQDYGCYEYQADDGKLLKEWYPRKKAVKQTTLICKTGRTAKEQENFLGYKFSNRRGYKGIDFTGKTLMFDETDQLNPKKVNSYIYKNFQNQEFNIDPDLADNLSKVRLTDCINFERIDFDNIIDLSAESVYKFDDVFNSEYDKYIKTIAFIHKGSSITKAQTLEGDFPVIAGGHEPAYYHNKFNREAPVITISASGAYAGFVNYWNEKIFASDCSTVKSRDENKISTKLIYFYLKSIQKEIYKLQKGQAQPHVYPKDIEEIKIPVPPFNIQQKIIDEIEVIEQKEAYAKDVIDKKTNEITGLFSSYSSKTKDTRLGTVISLEYGKSLHAQDRVIGDYPVYGSNGIDGYHNEYIVNAPAIIVGRKGSAGKVNLSGKNCWPIDTTFFVKLKDEEYSLKYIYYLLKNIKLDSYEFVKGTGVPGLNRNKAYEIKIKFLEKQYHNEFTIKIEALEREIEKNQQVLEVSEVEKKAVLTKYLEK